jgi:sodium pump decarboxylase gamma subunit
MGIELTSNVVLIGFGIVIAALIILICLMAYLGSAIGRLTKPKDSDTAQYSANPALSVVPAVEQGISDEVVAVIAAAVACMMGEGTGFTIRSVTRAPRKEWQMAGMAQNTRSF